MSTTASRTVQIQFSGDSSLGIIQSALDNPSSPGETQVISLAIGNNTILPPTMTGVIITSVTIFPPAGNTTVITLKGVGADAGFPIHITDPTSIGLDPTFVSLVLSVTAQINMLRLTWC